MLMIRAKWHQNSERFFAKMERAAARSKAQKSTKKQFGTKNLYLENILKVK